MTDRQADRHRDRDKAASSLFFFRIEMATTKPYLGNGVVLHTKKIYLIPSTVCTVCGSSRVQENST